MFAIACPLGHVFGRCPTCIGPASPTHHDATKIALVAVHVPSLCDSPLVSHRGFGTATGRQPRSGTWFLDDGRELHVVSLCVAAAIVDERRTASVGVKSTPGPRHFSLGSIGAFGPKRERQG